MRTVTFKDVVDGVFALAGVTQTTAADPAALLGQVIGFVNLRVREAWEFAEWPELCPVELRAYRPAYADATTYAAGAEVWFPSEDAALEGYYAARPAPDTPTAGQSPATHPAKWTRLVSFRRYIALAQPGETEIGEALRMFRRDPRVSPAAPGILDFELSSEGIVPPPAAGNRVWLRFRTSPPVYSAANYASETPADFPLPYVLAAFVQRAAFADFLRMDAKFEEAGRAEAKAYEELERACDVAGASQGQFTSARVQTY